MLLVLCKDNAHDPALVVKLHRLPGVVIQDWRVVRLWSPHNRGCGERDSSGGGDSRCPWGERAVGDLRCESGIVEASVACEARVEPSPGM